MIDNMLKLYQIFKACEPDTNFQSYEKKMLALMQADYSKKLKEISFDTRRVKIDVKVDSINEFEDKNKYLDGLLFLYNNCKTHIRNHYDFTYFNLPENFYKDGKLELDTLENVELATTLLDKVPKVSKAYKDIDLNKPFSLLYKDVTHKMSEPINLSNDISYKNISELKKILAKTLNNYYISDAIVSEHAERINQKIEYVKMNEAIKIKRKNYILDNVIPSLILIIVATSFSYLTSNILDLTNSTGFVKFLAFIGLLIATVIAAGLSIASIYVVTSWSKQDERQGALEYLSSILIFFLIYAFLIRPDVVQVNGLLFLIPTIIFAVIGFAIRQINNIVRSASIVGGLAIIYNMMTYFSFSLAYVIIALIIFASIYGLYVLGSMQD